MTQPAGIRRYSMRLLIRGSSQLELAVPDIWLLPWLDSSSRMRSFNTWQVATILSPVRPRIGTGGVLPELVGIQ